MCQFDFLISLQSNLAPLANVRHQIVRLLGSLGGQTNMLLLGSGEIDPSRAVAWDTENHLVFAVPFQDMKPNIYLGMMKTECVIRSAFHFQNSGSVIKWNGNFMEKFVEFWAHVARLNQCSIILERNGKLHSIYPFLLGLGLVRH